MKTSIVLITLIILNTSALLSEPLSNLITGVPTWLLIAAEITLLLILYLNNIVKDIRKICELNFNGIDLYGTKPKK